MAEIPFNRPACPGNEFAYMQDALARGKISGDGHYTKLCSRWLEERYGYKRCLLTTSCTHAMELAALLYDLKPGDEVILPSFTFVSTTNAWVLRGATPVFVDIEPATLNLDLAQLDSLITDKTRLIVPVHYAGISCNMDAMMTLANDRGIEVFEDAAQAIDASWNGKPLGSFGGMAAFSFHETKNIVCGEGGALLINEERWSQRAEIIREKGTNRSQFLRGVVDKYTWVDIGSSYLPSDLLAAYLYAQLEELETIQAKRGAIFDAYYAQLAHLEEKGLLRRPVTPPQSTPNYHMFYILLNDLDCRDRLMQSLRDEGIHAVFHYQPLHLSGMGQRFASSARALPVTEDLSERLLRLPLFFDLSLDDVARVCDAINRFFA